MLHLSKGISLGENEETVVGFVNEATDIKGKLTRGIPKQLEIMSVVGMPGIGKTTLMKQVYHDPLIVHYFHIRAWVPVSQQYRKRDLLLSLWRYVANQNCPIDTMSDERLHDELRKGLKSKRYLIVMDDIWDTRAWDDLRNSFPNDNNGSRIVFTSRLEDIALHAKSDSPRPFHMRFLTEVESWDLFQQKVFQSEACPPELTEIGKKITKKCYGLPLAIVLVAGIFANIEKKQVHWKQVEETLTSRIIGDLQICMETLELSYNHLPLYLKPCFIYFGAFPEDYEIPANMLMWLWIAEGFICEIGEERLEDVAEEYLMDLIGRSLVLVSRKSDGRIKSCVVHDLLHAFCRKKAVEDHFLQDIVGCQHFSSHTRHPPCIHRLCIPSMISWDSFAVPPSTDVHSFICFAVGNIGLQAFGFLSHCFRLGVLNITSVNISCFPHEILNLIFLRYLALGKFVDKLPSEISRLRKLETLIFHISVQCFELPHSIMGMENLRHICIRTPETVKGTCTLGPSLKPPRALPRSRLGQRQLRRCSIERSHFPRQSSRPPALINLQTLSWVDPLTFKDHLCESRNLRKLGVRGDISNLWFLGCHLSHLDRLENLKVSNASSGMLHKFKETQYDELQPVPITFPQNIRKLTLENTHLKWDDLSTLGRSTPSLEVLKLLSDACIGLAWKTSRDFPKLKFLKFHFVKIMEWEVSSDDFPSLQRLVLVGCLELKKIPEEIGEIPTLRVIEAHGCNRYVAESAWKIMEDQKSMGNSGLKIIDYKSWWESPNEYHLAHEDAISSSGTEIEDEQ